VSERVIAVVSVYDNPVLLPHFLAYYAELGVDRILVAYRTARPDDAYADAVRLARAFPADLVWRQSAFFADSDKAAVELELLAAAGLGEDDYVMHLDLDEFQEYPAPLHAIVRAMNAQDDWALRGWIVDRVAADGSLAAVAPEPSLWQQFPVACKLTERVLRGWTQKIVLCRRRVQLAGGVRHDTCNAHYERVPVGRSDEYRVHHFKWTAGVERRIAARLASAAMGPAYRAECERFLDHYRRHGRIDLSDPALEARLVSSGSSLLVL
jgi:glycosyl transferase family 2